MTAPAPPSAIELLDAIENKGFALTLEARGTAQKWVTGRNLFMGVTCPNGLTLRDAYGTVAVEIPLRAGYKLDWTTDEGGPAATLAQALRTTVKRGSVRRNSTLYQAIRVLAELVQRQT